MSNPEPSKGVMDTPRTDAALRANEPSNIREVNLTILAKQLERDLAAANAELAEANGWLKHYQRSVPEQHEALRTQLEEANNNLETALKENGSWILFESMRTQLEETQARLRECEKDRDTWHQDCCDERRRIKKLEADNEALRKGIQFAVDNAKYGDQCLAGGQYVSVKLLTNLVRTPK